MILRKALEVQLIKLIVEPFKAVGELEDIPKRLVIIDGLDECINSEQESRVEKKYAEDQEKVQVRVLELIHTLQSHRLPLSFLILSRPEAWIKQHIESRSFNCAVETVDLYEVGDRMGDVEKYVRAELSRIAANIGDEGWPGEYIARRFVSKANGHMLYASTVIRHIEDPYDDPRERLKNILDSSSDSSRGLASSTPFSSLYELYRQIMRSCPASHRSLMVEVLEDIIATRIYFPGGFDLQRALAILDSLSGRAPSSSIRAIRGLHAVLCPTGVAEDFGPPSSMDPFMHSTFPEFLMDRQLSLEFAIDLQQGKRRLLWKSLECVSAVTMQTELDEQHHLPFALHVFRPIWIGVWSSKEVVQSCEAEYLKAVHQLLAIDLTTCFIKLLSHSGLTLLTPIFSTINFFDSFRRFSGEFEFESLVQQAHVHVRSSIDGALVYLFNQVGQNGILTLEALSSSKPFCEDLGDYVNWIMSRLRQRPSNDFVQALKNLRREDKHGFQKLVDNTRAKYMRQLAFDISWDKD
ncbi:hypothetical protein EST38_g14382 [Candolleomyces aberdarensis]|uniref:NACHT domain-containing protein n=1 Tax=Candolleomyces aberdarensis TaxID=2316362 RepID=A0A4Q2CZT5_9AGAR|nr:hypothetical protein EST38_g14382 [Candolleomyces aberdarensis]